MQKNEYDFQLSEIGKVSIYKENIENNKNVKRRDNVK